MQLREKRKEFLEYVGIYLISSVSLLNLHFLYCAPGLCFTLVNELILIFKQRRYV